MSRSCPRLPAAASRNVTNDVKHYNLMSVMIALISGVSGLMIAYEFDTAAGATIVVIAAAIYFITFALRKRFLK